MGPAACLLGSADKGVAKSWRKWPCMHPGNGDKEPEDPRGCAERQNGYLPLTCLHKGFSDQTPCPEFLALGKFLQL